MIVHAGISAFSIEQIVRHGVADPTRDGRHPIALPTELIIQSNAESSVEYGAAIIHRRSSSLKTEQAVAGLPVVAHLTTAKYARSPLAKALARIKIAKRSRTRCVRPTLAGRGPADVTAHVEARPVVKRINKGWRLGVGPCPQIRGRSSANSKSGSECQCSNEFRARH